MSKDLPTMGGIQHLAFRCRDAQETCDFYEGILGMKLAAALAFDKLPGTEHDYPYMHLFFELGDGNLLAFFDVPSDATEEHFKDKWGMDQHVAMEVASMEEMQAISDRLTEKGINHFGPIDHEFVKSIYFYDPNGVNLEVTCKTADYDEIMTHEAAVAHDNVREWTKKTRDTKLSKGLMAAE